ncbi:hypothetical protein JMJ35_003312 [Cladonia borealis]|uniref:GH26 domain-containing protein n=1 Tax=Cladonia borealis TaxID=184061 RepID=A0AA39V984_9LECA|nr:hypothetical protein JMJ35_003312 [Cladonia borealis]
MRTSAYYLLALVAISAARPQYSPPSRSETSKCTNYNDCSPTGSRRHGYKHNRPEHGPYTAGGGYLQPTSVPTYGAAPPSGYQQLASASPYGGGGGGASGSPTAGGGSGDPSATSIAGPAQSSAAPLTTSGNATIGSGKVALPAGCESKNGIGIGWLPDSEDGSSLTGIISALGGVKPCWAGYYAQITGSTWDGSQLTSKVAEVKAGGAPYPIFVASVQPYIDFSAVPAMASQITTVMNELTSQGLTVWLRFAHEMNWYDSAAGGDVYKGTPQEFSTAWGAVSDAVKGNPNVLMFWSPNYGTASQLQSEGWYPSSGDIDVIGIDVYSEDATKTFANAYGGFCNGFGNIPFVIGETGSDSASADKTNWLEQLTSTEAKTNCPNYLGFSWFEYNKDGTDFRVATGGNAEAQSVLGTSSS